MLTEPQIRDLVAPLIAVNQYPLERAVALMEGFGQRGLLNPERVSQMSQEDVVGAMRAAGYDRGGYLPVLSYRLFKLMEDVAAGALDDLPALATARDRDSFAARLTLLHGFGPSTASSAWLLWTGA